MNLPEDERSEILYTLESKEKANKAHAQKSKRQEIIKV